MPYTKAELAARLKQQHPGLAGYTDDSVIKAALAKQPELRGQITDFDSPTVGGNGVEIKAAEEGDYAERDIPLPFTSAWFRLFRGVPDYFKGIGKGLINTLPGVEMEADPSKPYEQSGEVVGTGLPYVALPSGAARLATTRIAASHPITARVAGAAAEAGKNFLLSLSQGNDTGEAAKMAAMGAAGGAVPAAPPTMLREGARRSFARGMLGRAIARNEEDIPTLMDVAPDVLEEGGVWGRGKTMIPVATERQKTALAAQKAAAADPTPIPPSRTRQAIDNLQARVDEKTIPLPQARISDQDLDFYLQQPPPVQNALRQAWGLSPNDLAEEVALRAAPRSGDPRGLSALKRETGGLAALQKVYESRGGIPIEVLAAYRRQRGAVARRGHGPTRGSLPGATRTPETESSMALGSEASSALHDASDPLKRADRAYHVYTATRDALEKAKLEGISDSHRKEFFEYIAARVVSGAVVGGATGYFSDRLSPLTGVFLGAGFSLLRSTQAWNSTSAQFKHNLARNIENGNYELAFRMLEGMAAGALENAANEAERKTLKDMPQAPEE